MGDNISRATKAVAAVRSWHGMIMELASAPAGENFSCLNNIALALLTVFRSMDFCEQISSHTCMMFMLLPQSFDS